MTVLEAMPRVLANVDTLAYTRGRAIRVAEYLHRHGQGVKRIEIFGSIARGDCHRASDIDLIICAHPFTVWRWQRKINQMVKSHWKEYGEDIYNLACMRWDATLEILWVNECHLLDVTRIMPDSIDVFLFPLNWRSQLQRLQKRGHHHDPEFMRNIARDARTFVSGQGFPFPVRQVPEAEFE